MSLRYKIIHIHTYTLSIITEPTHTRNYCLVTVFAVFYFGTYFRSFPKNHRFITQIDENFDHPVCRFTTQLTQSFARFRTYFGGFFVFSFELHVAISPLPLVNGRVSV